MSAEVSGAQPGESFCPLCEKSFDVSLVNCPNDGTDLVRLFAEKDSMIGRKLGNRFLVEEKLGVGGMGTVYKATQISIGRSVAVKVIDRHRSGDPMIAKRFLREAKLSSRLSQPNTVSVYDFGQDEDGTLFLAMELIKGKDLAEIIKADGDFIPQRVKKIGVQLCDALEAAHKLSIIHRDLKPGNIMILDDPPGRDLLKVLDFGLAKSLLGEAESVAVTQSGMAMGTPLYISPEAITGKTGDARTDLYSVGIVLYELLAGAPPFYSANTNELFHLHLSERPPAFADNVPADLAEVVFRLLEKTPDARYSSAGETRQALLAAFDEAPVPVTRVELQPARGPVHTPSPGQIRDLDPELPPTLLAEVSIEGIGAEIDNGEAETIPAQERVVPAPDPASPLRTKGRYWGGGMVVIALVGGVYTASRQLTSEPQRSESVRETPPFETSPEGSDLSAVSQANSKPGAPKTMAADASVPLDAKVAKFDAVPSDSRDEDKASNKNKKRGKRRRSVREKKEVPKKEKDNKSSLQAPPKHQLPP